MSWLKRDEGVSAPSPTLVAGANVLRSQIANRWPERSKSFDEMVGHQDHKGLYHDIVIDVSSLNGSKHDDRWLADQLVAYAKNRKTANDRIAYVIFDGEVASPTYPKHHWSWRNTNIAYNSLFVSFTTHFEDDATEFDIPILVNSQPGVWDGNVPFFDTLSDAIALNAPNTATWRLACRLKELGFYEGQVLPEGKQTYPKNAIRKMQDYMGWDRTEYNEKIHRVIWKELRLSNNNP